ncbi:MAG: type II toxin-antitoxin system VapC family toxin [Pseudomonadota bacterium]
MIGLDTNVLVRYIVQDDPEQSPRATSLMNSLSTKNPGYITLVALVELVWVMKSCYKATREEIFNVIDKLARTNEICLENSETVIKALRSFDASKADFSDCVIEHSALAAGCEFTATFDDGAANSAGMRLVVQ